MLSIKNLKSSFVVRCIAISICCVLIVSILAFGGSGAVLRVSEGGRSTDAASTDTRIVLNGTEIYEKVMFINDTSYLPVRTISEMLGLKAVWDEKTRTIILNSETPGKSDSPDMKADGLSGVWNGTYTASQGETGVNILFDKSQNGVETAQFEMFPLEWNPEVPNGRFIMSVEYDKETSEIEMKGTEWLEKPSDYDVIDLIGIVYENYIRGVVTYKNKVVGRFSVKYKPM